MDLRLFQPFYGKAFPEIDSRRIDAKVLLDSESNIFLMSFVFCDIWRVPRVQRVVIAVVMYFTGKMGTGAGAAFTKLIKIIIGTIDKSLIASDVRSMQWGKEMIIFSGWWLNDHLLTNPNDSTNRKIELHKCTDHCSVPMDTLQELKIEWDKPVL